MKDCILAYPVIVYYRLGLDVGDKVLEKLLVVERQ